LGLFRREQRENSAAYAVGCMPIVVFEALVCCLGHSTTLNLTEGFGGAIVTLGGIMDWCARLPMVGS
jgi:hypothetical protein